MCKVVDEYEDRYLHLTIKGGVIACGTKKVLISALGNIFRLEGITSRCPQCYHYYRSQTMMQKYPNSHTKSE